METQERYDRAVELIEDMPSEERLRFFAWLSGRMGWHYTPKVEFKQDRLRRYVRVMNGLVGDDIMRRTRERDIVIGRQIVMYRMLVEGCSTEWVGKVFEMSHCTVIHARRTVEDWLVMPRAYPNEMAVYRKFNQTIDEI